MDMRKELFKKKKMSYTSIITVKFYFLVLLYNIC